MKNAQLKLFLSVLLSCNVSNSVEWTEQKKAAVGLTGLVAVYNVFNYIRYAYNDRPEDFYVKYSFPYAQMWYEEMIIKYPAAHFDTKRFLQADHNLPKENVMWSMLWNNIYLPQEDLIYIDEMYKKKMNGELWTDDEIMVANMIEWLLLYEAGHVELNYNVKNLCLVIGLLAAFETIKILYKESTDEAVEQSIKVTLNNYIFQDGIYQFFTSSVMWMRYIAMTFQEFFAIGCIKLLWIRDQEAQADIFANTYGAMDALLGGINYFQYLIDSSEDAIEETKNKLERCPSGVPVLSYFNMTADEFARKITYFVEDAYHQNPESRAQAIRDEIERRLKDIVVSQ